MMIEMGDDCPGDETPPALVDRSSAKKVTIGREASNSFQLEKMKEQESYFQKISFFKGWIEL